MIYTSNFFTVKNDPRGLAICKGQPGWWRGEVESRLAPATWEMVKMKDWNRFKPMFENQLKTLDVHHMAKRCEGRILLCWENLAKDSCHRTLVAEWFRKHGYECQEYVPEKVLDKKVKTVKTVSAKASIKKAEQLDLF